jgi:ribosomal protein S12 methylthiotransferase accessory factor
MSESSAGKGFRGGTHRAIDPRETIARARPHLAAMGITRVANVTGLDRIGIPVVMVCRPNSRSLAVSQGKGRDLDAAKASGLGESIEAYHAERITLPLRLATYAELRESAAVVDPMHLPRTRGSLYHPHLPILWIEGRDLLQREPVWVPYELVHFHYTLPQPTANGCFAATTNGLASGNTLAEAVSHAICEVVERDALTLWPFRGREEWRARRVDLATIDDPACLEILERYDAAAIDVTVRDFTSDVGLPVFRCSIAERSPDPWRPGPSYGGTGCHPARDVALMRALTEAAQNRLTVIAGSRDDVDRFEFDRYLHADTAARVQARKANDEDGARPFTSVASCAADTLDGDVDVELSRLRAVGIERVAMVDLTRPEIGWPVARVVIPGLEGIGALPGYIHGPRAATLSVQQRGALEL